MLRRRISIALGASVATFVILVGGWFTLNYFRVKYYNRSIEGPSPQTSPYRTIISTQEILHWPIVVAALCVLVLVLSIVTHIIQTIRPTQ